MHVLGRRLAYSSLAVGASAAIANTFFCRQHKRGGVPVGTRYYVGQTEALEAAAQETPQKTHRRDCFPPTYLPPSREEMIAKMKKEKFDVLVIGGGASGVGVLFDASSRGLKSCLVESNDFASGTSSKSTKLVHGGIRYLQKACETFDWGQLSLVCEALEERAHLLRAAPHIAEPLAILMPIYKMWQIPYYWFGVKAYGFLANLVCCGDTQIPPTSYLSARTSRFTLPLLPREGLKGSLLYFDGQMNDSRMCLSLALSPTVPGFVEGMQPAAAANHVAAKEFIKNENGQIIGVKVQDRETDEEFTIHCKVVVNCTGPLTDSVRKMDHEDAASLVIPAAGTHIVLPHWYTHKTPFGLLLPQTSDGRVLFLLPWEGRTVAGTTDAPANETTEPRPGVSEVDFLVNELSAYLRMDPQQMRGDIQSVWAGHRPLISQTSEAKDTAGVVRSHTVLVDRESGLISLMGGKWTTYRRMAQDAVDTLLEVHKDKVAASMPCRTKGMKVQGAVDPLGTLQPEDCRFCSGKLEHELSTSFPFLTFEQREHLVRHYGFMARDVVELAKKESLMEPLVEGLPYLKAEVLYACRYEQARSVSDILARRLPILFLDHKLGVEAIDTVCSMMAKELGWSAATANKKKEEANKYAETFTAAPEEERPERP
ncbi:glycerol-3-phosphate dehydrogenase, putative [Eimeria necatrix]|uniref:glycerol-3-phosphate dehydrogenase n=1 Tax=Eimeria necatrix TaxID=51315 RepID=U6N4B9_9EIME|nr:glycerol-3-phosphate dehydrogenase, putative [Eimeria necatrix]CDJ69550.1 glycerol-3-phosphate dehydrogenase, putative [Eimeria necatrix]